MAFVVWITGLPGSGKSTVASALLREFKRRDVACEYLRLDVLRRIFTPQPRYTEEERDIVYRGLVLLASRLHGHGVNVLVDATGHRRRWRALARRLIGKDFLEVWLDCPIRICMQREIRRRQPLVVRRMYEKALLRLKTGQRIKGLGEVIGVDVPFEVSPKALRLHSNKLTPQQAAQKILKHLETLNLV